MKYPLYIALYIATIYSYIKLLNMAHQKVSIIAKYGENGNRLKHEKLTFNSHSSVFLFRIPFLNKSSHLYACGLTKGINGFGEVKDKSLVL